MVMVSIVRNLGEYYEAGHIKECKTGLFESESL